VATREKEFQEKIRQLGVLVGELDQMSGGNSKVAAREVVQLLMEVHGTGLERIMELVFEVGSKPGMTGDAIISKLGEDPIVGNLLLLYSLHPDDFESRVLKAIENAGTRLRKFDSTVELVSIREGAVQLRLRTSGHSCGSTTKNLKSMVEENLYELAPDLMSLSISVPEDEGAGGFVPLENLMKHPLPAHAAVVQGVDVDGAD